MRSEWEMETEPGSLGSHPVTAAYSVCDRGQRWSKKDKVEEPDSIPQLASEEDSSEEPIKIR